MRTAILRLAAITAGVAVVLSCETTPTTVDKFGSGAGGPTGTQPANPNAPDTEKPSVIVDVPADQDMFNIGDPIFVRARPHDNRGLRSLVITGYRITGDVNLGTEQRIVRYGPAQSPLASETFRQGLTDTTITRFLNPVLPLDTEPDVLHIYAIVTDQAGLVDTTIRQVRIVAGPRITVNTPLPGQEVPQNQAFEISATVEHNDGVRSVTVRATSPAGWNTPIDYNPGPQTFAGVQQKVTVSHLVNVPADAPPDDRITIEISAIDVNGNPGAIIPFTVVVRLAGVAIPLVKQELANRLEVTDSIIIRPTGDGIVSAGFIVRDENGVEIVRRSQAVTPVISGPRVPMQLNLDHTTQGRKLFISSFATDQAGQTGYSVSPTSTTAQNVESLAFSNEALIVFGRTIPLPRQGIVGDIGVDQPRGHVFLTNTSFNRLEVWQGSTTAFFTPGIAVGSMPWGISRSLSPDHIWVGNSGGTNISRVFIGSNNPANMQELLADRVLTRTAPKYFVTEVLDPGTGKLSIVVSDPLLFSNRPQYIGQLNNGTVYFSTRPTTEAPRGMIHWYDPAQELPDLRSHINYRTTQEPNFLIMHVDSVFLRPATAGTGAPDTLLLCDHPTGTTLQSVCVRRPRFGVPGDTEVGVGAAIAALKAAVAAAGVNPGDTSDVVAIPRVLEGSIGYTDTTFVGVSGDGNWIAFGYGNTPGAGNLFVARGRVTDVPGAVTSPIFTQTDLTNNAAERIFGLALDSNGGMVAAHGFESYFATVEDPFHLRLQGKFSTFFQGAGIAFHPGAAGTNTPVNERLAFVASNDASIEVLDVAHYLTAGKLPIKKNMYGPLRVSRAFATDPPDVVLKLFGATEDGLVVIDVRDPNVTPVPFRVP